MSVFYPSPLYSEVRVFAVQSVSLLNNVISSWGQNKIGIEEASSFEKKKAWQDKADETLEVHKLHVAPYMYMNPQNSRLLKELQTIVDLICNR